MDNFKREKKSWEPAFISGSEEKVKEYNKERAGLVENMRKDKLIFEIADEGMDLPLNLQVALHNRNKLSKKIGEVQLKLDALLDKNERAMETPEYSLLYNERDNLDDQLDTAEAAIFNIFLEDEVAANKYLDLLRKKKNYTGFVDPRSRAN